MLGKPVPDFSLPSTGGTSFRLSDDLTARYFAHSGDGRFSLGA